MLLSPKKKIASMIVAGIGKGKSDAKDSAVPTEEPESDDSYAVEAVMEDFIKAIKEGSAKSAASLFKDLIGMCDSPSSYDEDED